jgi:hypothetical protein
LHERDFIGWRQKVKTYSLKRGQLKVEGKPCQVKRERKTYALTFNLVKSEGVSTVAIQTDVPLLLSFQKTELLPGLPRRYAPRF